ncbi:ribosome assembly RNA-binding protein YhbY [Kangiella sp. TOML190]|uniref:ribosome assembly RNA-binding protein YhbY n=1 Tax=Kangiella sp. TOML190 TaxID=2931351 RepID=UPI002041D7A2|nr:ribosome assembly RNA-binding protein YhbY [Kangiella sp. TOML190]
MSQLKALTKNQIKFLRAEAHSLKPVVMIGNNGVTEAVMEELDRALAHHELVKVKIRAEDREDKAEIIEYLCSHSNAHKIHTIGHNLVLYRKAKEPKLVLPKK